MKIKVSQDSKMIVANSKNRRKGILTALALTGVAALTSGVLMAGPSGGNVVAGDATINHGGNTTTIHQATQKAIIDWQSFNISADELVQFLQPGRNAVALNRITGNETTEIFGSLLANGNVFLLNPNGILFGAGSTVDVAGLMATTFNISNEDFLAGNYNFAQDANLSPSFIANHGRITVGNDGFVYLVAPSVTNSGLIVAQMGQVALASGNQFSIDFSGDGLIRFDVSGKVMDEIKGADGQPLSAGVHNSGEIRAGGGHVLLSADSARGLMASVVNNTGVIEATTLDGLTGSVTLSGGNVANMGTINVDGVEGDAGNILLHAGNNVVLGADSVTSADGGLSGSGGEIIVLGENNALIATGATLRARGGELGGNGGFIETSGYEGFQIGAIADVSAGAGQGGQWLIDPNDIEIVAGGGNVNISDENPFETTEVGAQLGVDLILAALPNGDVIITTTNAGLDSDQGNITLSTDLIYSGIASTLILNAHNDIILNGEISSLNEALGLTLNANSAAGGGVASGVGSIFVNNNISLLGGDFNASGVDFNTAVVANINTGGGVFDINVEGDVAHLGSINTAAGDITMLGDGAILIDGQVTTTGDLNIQALGGTLTGSGLISADGAFLHGEEGIGTSAADRLAVDVNSLRVRSKEEGAGIFVNNAGNLEILEVSVNDGEALVGFVNADLLATEFTFTQDGVLSLSEENDMLLAFHNIGGGVKTGVINVTKDGRLFIEVEGNITRDSGLLTADFISLATTGEGSTIGAEGDALRIEANSLYAEANFGDIVITDTAGGIELIEVNTGGDKSDLDATRAIITSLDGDIAGRDGFLNINAWATNLVASGAIGGAGHAITTEVSVLSASTTDGGIYIDQTGQLILGTITARENGQTPIVNANGDVVVDVVNNTAGTHNVEITASDDIFVSGQVTAPNELVITSTGGSLFNANQGIDFTARELTLNAAGSVGVEGGAFDILTSLVNAHAQDGGVYLVEGNTLRVGTIIAEGDDNDVYLAANLGNIQLGSITANGGTVTVESKQGSITDGNAAANNITAESATLIANTGIGSAGGTNAIDTNVDNLEVRSLNSGGIFISEANSLSSLIVQTANQQVSVGFLGGAMTFLPANSLLSMTGATNLDLEFYNTAGHVVLNGLNLGSGSFLAEVLGSITQQGANRTIASFVNLISGTNIGTSGAPILLGTEILEATTQSGGVFVNNNSGLEVNVTAGGAGSNVALSTTGGDLDIGSIVAGGQVSLNAFGDIQGTQDGVAVRGTGLTMIAGGQIGEDGDALETQITGSFDATSSNGGIYVRNQGDLSLLNAEATGGDIDFTNIGTAALGTVSALENDIKLDVSGNITDGNGNAQNLIADNLTIKGRSIGTSSDSIEIAVDHLVAESTNGGIYLNQTGSQDITLAYVKSAGGGSNIDIQALQSIQLGVVEALGNSVVITSLNGSVEDGRLGGDNRPNVSAKTLEIVGATGVGINAPLTLDVNFLSVSGGVGGVAASNIGAVAITPDSLVGKGASEVNIRAASITILDNNGGTITMDAGGSLVLIAETGNIVFLNLNDTIVVPGGGDIRLEANYISEIPGESGVIIVGNLRTTNGGSISLIAESNITIGLLDAGYNQGDVYVQAKNGIILDGNGSGTNIIAREATLIGRTPGLESALLTRETAIANNTALVALAAALLSDMDQLEAARAIIEDLLLNSEITESTARLAFNMLETQYNTESARLSSMQRQYDSLTAVRTAAQLAVDVAAFVTGAAQAVPFSGDAGADAVFAGIAVAFSVADAAMLAYELGTLNPQASKVDGLANDLDVATANLFAAVGLLINAEAQLNANSAALQIATTDHEKASIARDAQQQVRVQAINAYNQNNVIGTSTQALGVEASRLNIQAFGQSDIYVESPGNLGLGDITPAGPNAEVFFKAAGDISVVGQVDSPTFIRIDSTGGSIQGGTGILVTPDLIATAANGIGDLVGINTEIDRLALNAGNGGVGIINENQDNPLTVASIDGVTGIRGSGDISVSTTDDLILSQAIVDTSAAGTTTLTSGGDIVDNNNLSMNVTAGELVATAVGNIELDTTVDKITAISTEEGDITIRETNAVELTNVVANDGKIDIVAGGSIDARIVTASTDSEDNTITLLANNGGSIRAGAITAGPTSGNIFLTAAGAINDDENNATRVSGNDLVLVSGTGIGTAGAFGVRSLDTAVNTVDATVTGSGDVNIWDSGDLHVLSITTPDGDVTVGNNSGSLNIGTISANTTTNTITLHAAENITDANSDDEVNLTAANLAIVAGTGVGASDNHLEVEVDNMVAEVGAGGLYITDLEGGITIGGVTPNLGMDPIYGLTAASGNIVVTALSPITVNEGIAINGDGDITLTAASSDGDDDITINDVLVIVGSGDVSLLAGNSIVQNSNIAVGEDGNITLTAEDGDITFTDDSGTAVVGNGTITVSASDSISLGQNASIQVLGEGAVAFDAGSDIELAEGTLINLSSAGDISFTSGMDIVINANSVLQALEGDINLEAQRNITIGEQTSFTVAQDGNIALNAETGFISIDDNHEGLIGGDGNIGYIAATDITAGSDLNLGVGESGNILVTATTGSIDIGASGLIRVMDEGDISISAENDVNLGFGFFAVTEDGDISVTASEGDLSVGDFSWFGVLNDGSIEIVAGNDITYGLVADISVANDGNITITAGNDITFGDMSQTEVGNEGDITVTAGNNYTTGESASISTGTGDITYTATAGSITAGDEFSMLAEYGDISLTAGSDITLGDDSIVGVEEDGNVTLTAGSGTITLGESNQVGVDNDGSLSISARQNFIVGDYSELGVGNDGNVTIVAGDSVNLGDYNEVFIVGDGDMSITAITGSITVGEESELGIGENGNLSITAGTDITFGDLVDAGVEGDGNVTLTAGNDITLGVENEVGVLGDGDLTITAGNNLTVGEESELGVIGSGNVDIAATSGNVVLAPEVIVGVGVDGDIVLTAGQNITIGSGSEIGIGNDGDLSLYAGNSLSTANNVGVVIGNDGDLSIGALNNVSLGVQNLVSIVGDGDMSIAATTGSITVGEESELGIEENGNLSITAGTDITFGDLVDAGVEGDGNVTLTAGNDITLGVENEVGVLGDGDLTITAGNDLTVGEESELGVIGSGNVDIGATSGNVVLAPEVIVGVGVDGDIVLTAGQNITIGSGSEIGIGNDGDFTLYAGNSLSTANNVGVVIGNDGDLSIGALNNVSLGVQNLVSIVGDGDMSIAATTGSITVGEESELGIGENGNLSITAGTDITFGDLVDAGVEGDGNVTLTAGNDITLGVENEVGVLGDGDLTITAGNDLTVGEESELGVIGSGNVDIGATSGNIVLAPEVIVGVGVDGDIALTAGQNITIGSGSEIGIGNDGEINLAATEGSLTTGDDVAVSIGNDGDILLFAHNDVTLGDDNSYSVLGDGNIYFFSDAGAITTGSGNFVLTTNGFLAYNAVQDITIGSGNQIIAAGDAWVLINSSEGGIQFGTDTSLAVAQNGTVVISAELDIDMLENSSITIGEEGELTINSAEGSFRMAEDTLIFMPVGIASISAGDSIEIEQIVVTSGSITLVAEDGSISGRSGVPTHLLTNDLEMTAGGSIGAQLVNLETTVDTIVALASEGGIYINEEDAVELTSITTGNGAIEITAGGDIHAVNVVSETDSDNNDITLVATNGGHIVIDNIDAGSEFGDVTLEANTPGGEVRTNTVDGIVTGDNLVVTAANGIHLDNASVNEATLAVTGEGNISVNNDRSIVLNNVTTTDGEIYIYADGELTAVNVVSGSINNLGHIELSAEDSIYLDYVAATGSTEATVRIVSENGGVYNVATDKDAINVLAHVLHMAGYSGIGTDGNGAINVSSELLTLVSENGGILLTEADGLERLMASAAGSIELTTEVSGDGDTNAAYLNSGEDITLVSARDGDITVGAIGADGHVEITATGGSIIDDNDNSTRIIATSLGMTAANGIGAVGDVSTRSIDTFVESLDAQVTVAGDINISEFNSLTLGTVSTPDGDITIQAATGNILVGTVEAGAAGNTVTLFAHAGAIRDAFNNSNNNISATNLALYGAAGVGQSSNYLDVTVDNLVADGGNGGVYINNLSANPLTIGGVTSGLDLPQLTGVSSNGGNIGLNTQGDINLNEEISNQNGNISIIADGTVNQNTDISTTGGGDITVKGGQDVVMGQNTKTVAGTGSVSYEAGNELVLTDITVKDGSKGGQINVTAPVIIDSNPDAPTLKGGYINIVSPDVSEKLVMSLIDKNSNPAAIRYNGRIIGGQILEENQVLGAFYLSNEEIFNFSGPGSPFLNLFDLFSGSGVDASVFQQSTSGVWQFN